ncbi:hypothetical protein MYXO_01688 [Myxococcaceae bacterium]|nr:hypothetical protein MYXO_01688 [Myxococcaceae bacterium]
MEAKRAEGFSEGTLARQAMTPAERAIEDLARSSVRRPAHLSPADLDPLVAALGESGALELVGMVGAFHVANRIADLVGIESEIPIVQRRLRRLRSFGVRLQARVLARVLDLSNRSVEIDVAAALDEIAKLRATAVPEGYRRLALAPGVAGWALSIARGLATIDANLVARVSDRVRASLASSDEDVEGLHPRPPDPLDALVFVGTRYPARTTDALVASVREATGFDDARLTDLVFAIAAANAFERVDRLLG